MVVGRDVVRVRIRVNVHIVRIRVSVNVVGISVHVVKFCVHVFKVFSERIAVVVFQVRTAVKRVVEMVMKEIAVVTIIM